MKRAVRPATPADAAAIVALFAEVGLHPNVDPRHLSWKYWQPRADRPGPRSFVLASDSELLAHAAIIPGTCAWGTREIPFTHVIDWAARRGEMGAGVALMKHIGQQAGALLAVGGSAATLGILPHIGFRPAGTATGYVRTLFPLRMLRGVVHPTWRLGPRLARSVSWMLAAPRARGAGWQARRLSSDEASHIASVLPRPTEGMAVTGRSVELFRYMLSCPIAPMSLFAVERAGRAGGYFLLASTPGQVRIADCWMESREPGDWRAMILCAVEQAKHDPQAAEVVIWASDPLLAGTLAACGFHPRGETAMQVRAADAAPAGLLRVQMLDNDAAFFHEGRNEYWA
ncbi:MAG TPA: hypothetical protein VH109_10035 [Steroidobacteraceae bacterium]|nr:hypothetical protein [Steroidobacteraceae bacterium]